MNFKPWFGIAILFLMISCASRKIEIAAISACLDILEVNRSSNISRGRISGEYSLVRVRVFSATDVVVLSFGKVGLVQSESLALDAIEHRSGIYCLIDGNGSVAGLVSPEYTNGGVELIEFVSGFESIEDQALTDIDKSISAGESVTVNQTRYSIGEGGIEKIGKTQQTKLETDSWSVHF